MKRLLEVAMLIIAMLSIGVPNDANATAITFDLENRFFADGPGNAAGFVFTGPGDRFFIDFSTGDVQLTFDPVDANLATVSIQGSANGHIDSRLPNPNAADFYNQAGLYTFDFEFVVQRENDLRFVNTLATTNIGTISNPGGESVSFDAKINPAANNVSFFLNFSDDMSTIVSSGWVMGNELSGDFHFTGARAQTPTDVPEPMSLLILGSGLAAAFSKRKKV